MYLRAVACDVGVQEKGKETMCVWERESRMKRRKNNERAGGERERETTTSRRDDAGSRQALRHTPVSTPSMSTSSRPCPSPQSRAYFSYWLCM